MNPSQPLSDRFEIEHRIGVGGMGEVFRARDRVSGEPVAVKVLSEDHSAARFIREVELLAELSHPGIVRHIAHGQSPAGDLFLVMEWLEGEDLKERLARAPLTMGESVRLATRVAEALGVAHARRIVHRDLKPSNLFLPGGQIEQVKVLDFGIAQREGRTQLTQTGSMIGTPGYMAPEQARSTGEIDARADVFALGCVLFQCLTGTPPFDGDSAAVILSEILFGEVPRVRALWPDVPEELDALIAQMLAKEPALRPSDGANLAAALAALGPIAHSAAVAPKERVAKAPPTSSGERRFLSVLLLGPVAEGGEPAVVEAELERAIRPYGGRLEQLADGSTIVVLEADRQVASDHAARAARCALSLRALVGRRPLAAVMGRARPTNKLPDSDAIGRAARLLAHAARAPSDPPPVVLDDMTAGLLDPRFDVIESEAGLVLCGERPLMQGARTLLGRPTSCVGRDWELNVLAGILDGCIDESKARAVVVTAAAGMGKSRLGAEFVGRVRQRDDEVAIWIGRGDSLRAGSTLDLLAQALRGALGIGGGEPLPDRRDKLRRRVAEIVPAGDQQRVTEFLGELVGVSLANGDGGSAQLRAARQDAQLMSEQVRNAWLDFLLAETAVRLVLLLLEDLHWGDFGTVRFIDTALRDRSDQPWMVLALARPEVFEIFPKLWAERQNVQEIRLKELGRKAGERLVRQVLGNKIGSDTVERLVRQADGNTFYLEELIRAVAEGKGGALPETVLAMVETRLGQLPLEARRVLRAASVFGEVCWDGGVALLLGGAMVPTAVAEWLARLIEQEMLVVRPESRFSGERELAFRHALLHEGAYASSSDEDRQLGHRLAGEWLEQHGEGDPLVLAGHFERGGDPARAADHYLRAAEQAFHVLDMKATLARAGLGLACAVSPELRHALLGMRCEVYCQDPQLLGPGVPDAEELLRSAPRGSIAWSQGASAYIQGVTVLGRIDDLLALIGLLQEVEPLSEAVGKMALSFIIGIAVLDDLGRVAEATALEQRFFAVARPHQDRDPLVRFWRNFVIAMRWSSAHDDPWSSLQHGDENQAIFELIGGERNYLVATLYRGITRWHLGSFTAAEQMLEEIGAADESLGLGSSMRRFCLAWLRADRGALDAAHALAIELREHGRAYRLSTEEGRGCWVLAEVLRRRGDLEGADRELPAALAMVVPHAQPGVLATLSAVRLAQGRAAEALAAAEDAVARAAAMGGCSTFRGAYVRLAHAESLHATGARDAARDAIAEARAHLLAMTDKIPDPDYRQSFLENVPENARTLALARDWVGEPPA
jgi:eukaryotic-like serine/threonine-protein kinase